MATNFPTSLDSFSNPTSGPRNQAGQVETEIIANLNDSVEAIEGYIGVVTETDEATITGKVKKVDKLTTKGDVLVYNGTGYDRLPVGANGYQIVADSGEATGLKYIPTTSGGTVTNVAVTTANGFAGTVATSTTTPEITLTTSVTGLMKGNGIAVSAATPGTDYYEPSGTDVAVVDGGTGRSSHTAYALIAGGTTATGPQQSLVGVGTSGQVLTSNGAGTLPTFQTASFGTLANSVTDTTYDNTTAWVTLATTTVPGGYLNGNGLLIDGAFLIRSQGFLDSRDNHQFKLTYGGADLATFTVRPNTTETLINVTGILKGTGGSAQTSSLSGAGTYWGISAATPGTVNSTTDQTLTLQVQMGTASATCYIKHRNTLIRKI